MTAKIIVIARSRDAPRSTVNIGYADINSSNV